MQKLNRQFFNRDAVVVARELIGKILVHKSERAGLMLAGRIIETEAYRGDDPACHAYHLWKSGRPPQGRAGALYGPPGMSYVYLNYGIHWLFNVVTDVEHTASAVLIRGIIPLRGIEWMRAQRPRCADELQLGIGPGNLTRVMDIDKRHHGVNLINHENLFFADDRIKNKSELISVTPRIGIAKGRDLLWRFVVTPN